MVARVAAAFVLASLPTAPAYATDWWGPREDVGVAAADTRTGKVLWEAWRLAEVPAGTSREERTAVECLLAMTGTSRDPVPHVPLLPDVPVKDLVTKDPWTAGKRGPSATASEGKSLIYYRTGIGVIALDRQTKQEVWRLLTTRYPYPSHVLEAGDNLAFIQIGTAVPRLIYAAVIGGNQGLLKIPKLEPHPLKQRVAAAMLLHHYGDGYLRPELRKLIRRLREEKSDPAAEPAAKTIEKLLATWPNTRDSQRLLDGCVAALL